MQNKQMYANCNCGRMEIDDAVEPGATTIYIQVSIVSNK